MSTPPTTSTLTSSSALDLVASCHIWVCSRLARDGRSLALIYYEVNGGISCHMLDQVVFNGHVFGSLLIFRVEVEAFKTSPALLSLIFVALVQLVLTGVGYDNIVGTRILFF